MSPTPTSAPMPIIFQFEVAADDALRERGDQRRLRSRQRIRRDHADIGRAGEAVGLGQQVEHHRNHGRAGDDADDQRDLLAHRRGADELSGLQVLQVVVGDRGAGEHDRRDEQREGHQRRAGSSPSARTTSTSSEAQITIDENADAGDRAVRRADQPGHVAADPGDEEADQQHERHGDQREPPPRPAPARSNVRT